MCFAFKSATVFQWIRRNFRVRRRESLMGMRSQRALMNNSTSQRERCFSPLDVEMIDQLSTWKCCVHVSSGLCDVGSDRESPLQYEFGKCVG